ncbi:hypothetical protein PUN28_011148 [Cardiocondyla obscurior]|uniref:Secreted protein n=1 Tax=Cardiocondyla obscurior TaxID=286306 RepID=A0AAW2FNX6_9HYME
MLCHATLCLCPVAPSFSLAHATQPRRRVLFPPSSFASSSASSSCVASLFLHLAHLSSGYSWLLCPMFFSFPRNLRRLALSRFLTAALVVVRRRGRDAGVVVGGRPRIADTRRGEGLGRMVPPSYSASSCSGDGACDRDGHMAPESERGCLMSFSSAIV